ncbi:hypothetical protein FBU31_001966, partial [Coemansia sp. 'formosensis']
MSTDGAAQQGTGVTASGLFRSVWKGSDGLVGAQGRFRVDQYIKCLSSQSWRSLGTLLVQLLRPMEKEAEADPKAQWSMNRCLMALAVTVRYMQTASQDSLVTAGDEQPLMLVVNAEFVARLFAAMVRHASAAGESGGLSAAAAAAHEVLRTTSAVLTVESSSPARFASTAVLDGILGPIAAAATDDGLQRPSAKRRRTGGSPGAMISTLRLLTRALEQSTLVGARKYAIRILRAHPDIPSRLLTAPTTSEAAHWRVLLVCALADRGLDMLGQQREAGGDSDSVVADGVFACLRDMLPLVLVPPSDEAGPRTRLLGTLAKLCLELAAEFKPRVADGSIYAFCSGMRRRCYQWAVLCRLSTWATSTSDGSLAGPAAEGGHTCWMHIAHAAVTEFESSIWLLLLAESLGYVALEYPSSSRAVDSTQYPSAAQPLFTLADESQVKVFTAVAMVLGRVGCITDALLVRPNPASQALLPGVVRACARLTRLVSPTGASLGLFQPMSEGGKQQLTLADVGSAGANAYVFDVDIPLASATSASAPDSPQPREDVTPTLLVEQAREMAEELVLEAAIANVFAALNSVARAIIAAEGTPSVGSVVAFWAVLRWISLFASSARDNVYRQTRVLERDYRNKIRIVVDKARLHMSATDWSRLQGIPAARCLYPNVMDIEDDGEPTTTYRPVVIRALHTLIALSLPSLLGDEHSQPVLLEQTLAWDSEEKTGSKSEDDAKPHPALLLCQALKRLMSDDELKGVSLSALQILASILGVHPHLVARDIAQLRLPHLHVREHSPRSSEALMNLVVQSGLARLVMEPAIVVRFVGHVRDGSMLRNAAMLRSMQMWLDVIGNIVRHSLFRFRLHMVALSSAEGDDGSMDFSTWWPLALTASARCLVDVGEADAQNIRLACIMPSHLLSWQAHLPASDIPAARLLDLRRYGASSSGNGRAQSLRQLLAWLVSFPQPAATHVSVLCPIYFLSCELWLDVKLSDSPGQQLPLQVSRDVWGISTDALTFLSRLVVQPALRRTFVRLGLVNDFASSVLTKLISRRDYPPLVARCMHHRGHDELALSDHELMSEDVADLVTIPLVESNDKSECASDSEEEDKDSPSPLSPADLVGRLLNDISHSRKGGGAKGPKRSAKEYYGEPMLGQLWSQFTKRLLRLPTTIAFGRVDSGDAENRVSAKSPAERRGELSELLEDADGVLFDICAPLLAVREGLAHPSIMFDSLGSVVSAADIVFTIGEAAQQQGVSLRTCISAALLLPELYGAAEPLRGDVDSIGRILLGPLVQGLVGGDEGVSGRCQVALMFMAWKQRRCISEQVAACAAQLKGDVKAMMMMMDDYLQSSQPYLDTVSATEKEGNALDLVLLSGKDSPKGVASSVTLLAKHSPVLNAMLAGDFAEAQSPAPGMARRVSLQCDHTVLSGMLDVFHRCLGTSRMTMDMLRAELERDFGYDQLAAFWELAAFYGLRPVVTFLAWLFAASFSTIKDVDAATLDRFTLLHGDCLSGFQASDQFVHAIRRCLAALLLLNLDQVDPASV